MVVPWTIPSTLDFLTSPARAGPSFVATSIFLGRSGMSRRRAASGGLGGEIRGDTGAPAVSTLDQPALSSVSAALSHVPLM